MAQAPQQDSTKIKPVRKQRLLRAVVAGVAAGALMPVIAPPLVTAIHGAAGKLFPTAGDVLREQGLNPNVAANMTAGITVYVRRGEYALARTHAFFDAGLDFKIAPYAQRMHAIKTDPYAPSNTNGYVFAGQRKPDRCFFYIKPKSEFAQAATPALTDARYSMTLLHEIRHCAPQNYGLGLHAREVDADFQAYRGLKTLFGAQAALQIRLERNVAKFGALSDTVLGLEALEAGRPVEERAMVIASIDAASAYYDAQALCAKNQQSDACIKITARAALAVKPLAAHRLDLYFNARAQLEELSAPLAKISIKPKIS